MTKSKINRRTFINTTAKASLGLAVVPHFNILKSKPKMYDTVIGHGDFKYKVHKSWGDLDRAITPVKNCHEMVMDSKGRLILVGDNTKNNILIYDKSGKLLDSWGIRYKGGHGLSIWNDGSEDFLFICDAKGESMIKTTTDGRELMIIGHPSKYGAYDKKDKFKPTESAIGPNGDIYIADGYGANYVLQFTKDGEFIRKIGEGRGTGQNQFQTSHGVCIDYRGKEPTLLITSRAANCFKRFTLDGKYIEQIDLPGAFVCRPVIHNKNLYSGVCWSSEIDYVEGDKNTHPFNIINIAVI